MNRCLRKRAKRKKVAVFLPAQALLRLLRDFFHKIKLTPDEDGFLEITQEDLDTIHSLLNAYEDSIPQAILTNYEIKARKTFPCFDSVTALSQKYLVTAVSLEMSLNSEEFDVCPVYIELCRVFENELDKLRELWYLFCEEFEYVLRYFKGICSDNHYVVRIFKIVDSEVAEPVYSSEQDSNSQQFRIRNNTSFSEVISTKKPYFINDIGYFLNQGRNHDKQFFTEDRNAIYQYQSIVCFPIGNNPIKGYLLVEIQKPLNDLIDINMISDFLNKVCDKINHSWQL